MYTKPISVVCSSEKICVVVGSSMIMHPFTSESSLDENLSIFSHVHLVLSSAPVHQGHRQRVCSVGMYTRWLPKTSEDLFTDPSHAYSLCYVKLFMHIPALSIHLKATMHFFSVSVKVFAKPFYKKIVQMDKFTKIIFLYLFCIKHCPGLSTQRW